MADMLKMMLKEIRSLSIFPVTSFNLTCVWG